MPQLILRFVIVFAFAPFLAAQNHLGSPCDQAFDGAANLFNQGHIRKARDKWAELLQQNPRCFKAYRPYWDAIARTGDEHARRAQAEHDLNFLKRVPVDDRTETFYGAYEYALVLTGHEEQRKAVHREQIKRYPRGLAAQDDILRAARAEKDPVRVVAKLRDYIRQFPESISATESAAHHIYVTVLLHQEHFRPDDLLGAASDWERHERAFIKTFGNPARYYLCLKTIAEGVLSASPSASIDYCQEGEAFVEAQWPQTGEFSEDARRDFWPVLLKAYVALKQWPAAVRVGEAVDLLLERGTFLGAPADVPKQAEARAAYAAALEAKGDTEAARRQFGLAAELDPARQQSLDEFQKRHPVSDAILRTLKSDWEKTAARLRQGSAAAAKSVLLASEVNRPATPLGLRDLEGHRVSLEQFRGKPLVLSFWATWCAYCYGELDELSRLHQAEHGSAQVLAASIDRDKDAVAPFAHERGYRFPIAVSDGTGEAAYGTDSIPELYVLDAAGDIRFHLTGYADDGMFASKLRWMLEAVTTNARR
jgi:peroxiredoxin